MDRLIPVCGCAAPDKVEGLPLPLCGRCGRMIVPVPEPVMDPGVSEHAFVREALGCRMPAEQSLAAAEPVGHDEGTTVHPCAPCSAGNHMKCRRAGIGGWGVDSCSCAVCWKKIFCPVCDQPIDPNESSALSESGAVHHHCRSYV